MEKIKGMKKAFFLLLATLWFQPGWSQQLHPDVLRYIDEYKEIAISEMRRTGVPAAIKLAQGIHETMAGKSPLVLKSNNHFGIKCKTNWDGSKFYHDDDAKNECFRGYANAESSYKDHSDFLRNSSRYHFLFELDPSDYKGWANGLKSAGYATNPKYPVLLINLIETYNLQEYTYIGMADIKIPPVDKKAEYHVKPPRKTDVAKNNTIEESKTDFSNSYAFGEQKVNETRAIYVEAGTSLLALAQNYGIPLRRLLDFNDFEREAHLETDQLVYLQRKRKHSHRNFHIVKEGETLHDIAQINAIRLESVKELNHLQYNQIPAVGEQLYLKTKAPVRPLLIEEARAKQEALSVPENTVLNHTIKKGETLSSVARDYNVTVEQLKDWNSLKSNQLAIGQKLIIKK